MFLQYFCIFFMRRQTKAIKTSTPQPPFAHLFSTQGNCLFCVLTVTPLSTRLSRSFGLLEDSVVFNFRLELMNFVQIKQPSLCSESLLLSGACNMLQFSAQRCIIRRTLHCSLVLFSLAIFLFC